MVLQEENHGRGRKKGKVMGMQISAKAVFDVEMGNSLEKKKPGVCAINRYKTYFGIGSDL